MLPTKAYNIRITSEPVGEVALDKDHGWVFGLPRGISTKQWPLDPITGAPLMHGFTILLPEQYRCHGPEIVGFSFFATPADVNDGGTDVDKKFADMILNTASTANRSSFEYIWSKLGLRSKDDRLSAYRNHVANSHPRLHRMTDILDYHYAVILLTEAEINGEITIPPDLPIRDGKKPEWMRIGSAAAYLEPYMRNFLNVEPQERFDWNLALAVNPRTNDPNAGKAPLEVWEGKPTATGYISPYDEDNGFALRSWAKDHSLDHLGGTMRPFQGILEMSPFYVGFGEHFGGYNFGGGNAQLDFKEMVFDWAQ